LPRNVFLGLQSVSLFLLLFPLTLGKPGLPPTLKADESAYYLMALSLAHDGDLRLETEDQERLFAEFPYRWASNLIVMTDDGWNTTLYGKPLPYPLFAAPFAALFGANGMIFFNMVLLVAMMWMGALHLSRFNAAAPAALFSCGFFLLSLGFVYVFWLQTEVFNMAAIAASLFLGLRQGRGEEGKPSRDHLSALLPALLSGAALALAVYNKPFFLALCLPVLAGYLQHRRWRRAASWALGFMLCFAGTAGLSTALTGHWNPYLSSGIVRQGVTVCEPEVLPMSPVRSKSPVALISPSSTSSQQATGLAEEEALEQAHSEARVATGSPTGNTFSWLFRIPDLGLHEAMASLGNFLWGRHTGVLLYMPFAALAALLFLLHGRRRLEGWFLLLAIAVVAGYLLLFLPHNWHGGGGFIGNRYFVNIYPAFLFLVTSLRPRWLLPFGFGIAGLFLAPLLLSPMSSGGPEPTLQSHVRNAPFRFFPFDPFLRHVPGYHRVPLEGVRVIGRRDQVLPQGTQFWLRGAARVELWMITTEEIETAVLQIRNLASTNRAEITMEGDSKTLLFESGEQTRQVELRPEGPSQIRFRHGAPLYVYRIEVSTERGRVRNWTRYYPPSPCPQFARNDTSENSFYVGAILTYLGDGANLNADVFANQWQQVSAIDELEKGTNLQLPITLLNTSASPWPNRGPARVKLSYHWLNEEGETVTLDGSRTELPQEVAAGEAVAVTMDIEAPDELGSYILELEPVFEYVAWFSRRGGTTYRLPVEVVNEATPAEEAPAAEAIP